MKIRIEGCTAEQLADYSNYLSLSKEYEVVRQMGNAVMHFMGDNGREVHVMLKGGFQCPHLPEGAKWVEVTE